MLIFFSRNIFFLRFFKHNDLHFENPTTGKTDIWANIFQIQWNQSTHLHFQLKYGGTSQPHVCSVTTDIQTNYWQPLLLASTNHQTTFTNLQKANLNFNWLQAAFFLHSYSFIFHYILQIWNQSIIIFASYNLRCHHRGRS